MMWKLFCNSHTLLLLNFDFFQQKFEETLSPQVENIHVNSINL